MAQQTQPIDRKYPLSTRLGMMAQIALENWDFARALELSTASHEALQQESLARQKKQERDYDIDR